jgi:putative transposase
MPWKESRIMNEKIKFVGDVLKGDRTMTELCRTYGIARKTGYKWLERYQTAGPAGLEELRTDLNDARWQRLKKP